MARGRARRVRDRPGRARRPAAVSPAALMKRRSRRSLEARLWDSSETHVASFQTKTPDLGLEPTTSAWQVHAMFGPVRGRSLNPRVCRLFAQASERERIRANAQPCHSCHALSGTETLPSQVQNRGGCGQIFPTDSPTALPRFSSRYWSMGFVGKISTRSNVLPFDTAKFIAGSPRVSARLLSWSTCGWNAAAFVDT